MIKWAIKKYVIGKINDVLEKNKDNVLMLSETLNVWVTRLEKVLKCFKCLLAKIDDGKLDSDEIDEAVVDVETVIKEW